MHAPEATHAREIIARKAVFGLHLDSKTRAALTQAALENALSVLRLETSAETMRACSLDLFRLIVSLHAAKIARISGLFKTRVREDIVIHRL